MNAINEPLLSIKDLSVQFGEGDDVFYAVKKMCLDIAPAEIIGLIGESGSGKTTSALSLMGLLDGVPCITSGKAQWQGTNILPDITAYTKTQGDKLKKKTNDYSKDQRKLMLNLLGRQIAMIFQEPRSALNPYLSIGSHMLESIKRGGGDSQLAFQLGCDMLRKVGIIDPDQVWQLFPHQVSGGMAQRVMVAMALSCSPKLIIADEPTTALDVTTQAKLLELFLKLKNERQLSIWMITHDIGVVRLVADRVYVMHNGKIVESGKTNDVIKSPQHPYTQGLLNSFAKIGDRRKRLRRDTIKLERWD